MLCNLCDDAQTESSAHFLVLCLCGYVFLGSSLLVCCSPLSDRKKDRQQAVWPLLSYLPFDLVGRKLLAGSMLKTAA